MVSGHASRLAIAAWAFAGAALFGSAVSIRDRAPGEPLGIRLPLSVPLGLLLGWGAGVAAPWPMPVIGLLAAKRSTKNSRTGLVCAGLGVVCIAGQLVEPIMGRPKTWTGGTRAAIIGNFATSIGMIAAGVRCAMTV